MHSIKKGKLQLKTETIQALEPDALAHVAGGENTFQQTAQWVRDRAKDAGDWLRKQTIPLGVCSVATCPRPTATVTGGAQ